MRSGHVFSEIRFFSIKLCATSKDMITVFLPISAERIPVAAAIDVLPVPPLPAKKMILTAKLLIHHRVMLEFNQASMLSDFCQTEFKFRTIRISMKCRDFT